MSAMSISTDDDWASERVWAMLVRLVLMIELGQRL